jgi:hypothetical protein
MKKGELDDVFRYELDNESWRPTYIFPKRVDHLNTIREFINVFGVEVQKLEATSFSLGLVLIAIDVMPCNSYLVTSSVSMSLHHNHNNRCILCELHRSGYFL